MSVTTNRPMIDGKLTPPAETRATDPALKWSYFVGQSEGKAKVDSDWF